MDVDDDDLRLAVRLVDQVVDELPHAPRRVEEERAEQVDHGDGRAVARRDDGEAAAGSAAAKFAGRITRFDVAR